MKVAGVAIVKDEATYLDEWILYHTSIGIDHIFIYDNFSSDNTLAVLNPYIRGGLVTLINWPLFRGQDDAYAHAFKTQVCSFDWVACFDIDEFFMLKKHKNIKEFLTEFSEFEQIVVPWRFFGHSNHIQRPEGLVIENFITCDDKLHTHTKYFIKPEAVADAGVHVCTTKNKKTVNEHKQLIDEGRFHSNHTADIIQLNHYYTRSYQEYENKITRGQADGRDLKRLESFKYYDFKLQDHSLAKLADGIKAMQALIRETVDSLPINTGFLSDLFLPNDNLPIKYVIRDYIDEIATKHKGAITKHHKYNFGSVLQCHDDFTSDLTTSLYDLFSAHSVAEWQNNLETNTDNLSFLGCPVAVGKITVSDSESVTFEVSGSNWLGDDVMREVSFKLPSEGTWIFAISIGRIFIRAPKFKVSISPEKHSNSVSKIQFDTTSIW